MSIPTSTNLTLAFGNDWSGDASITFTGLESDIDAGLATTERATTGGDVGSTASVSLSAMVSQPGYGYSPSNQHFDQYIAASGATWTADNTAAEGLSFAGQRGYLATIPSDKIDNFVSIRIQGAENVWFGAESVDTPSSSPAHLAVGGGARWPHNTCPTARTSSAPATSATIPVCIRIGPLSNRTTRAPPQAAVQRRVRGGHQLAGHPGFWNDLAPDTAGSSGYVVAYGDQVNGSGGFAGVAATSSNVLIAGAPSAPTDVSGTRGGGSAVVSFTAPAACGSPITDYTVTASPGDSTTLCSASPCTVTGLTNGTNYTFTVAATNICGIGPASSASSAVTPGGPPAAPTNFTVARGNGSATLRFTPPGDNGTTITGYQYSTDGVNWQTLPATAVGADRTAMIRGLTNGTLYAFGVRAVNGDGPGTVAGPVSTTPARAPDAPTGVSGTRGDGSALVSFTAPATGGSPITGYQYSLNGGLTWHSFATTTSGATLSGVIHGLTNGRTYSVTVWAVNATGPGAASAPASVTPHSAPARWYMDPLTPPNGIGWSRSRRIRRSTHGKMRHTEAIYRTHSGTLARAITCEGYADYAGGRSHESTLSQQRAAIVCTVLRRNAGLRAYAVGYGPQHPVDIGGTPQIRIDNRRVDILVTR